MQKQDKHRGKSKESLRYAFVSVFGFATGIISDNPLETAALLMYLAVGLLVVAAVSVLSCYIWADD